MPKKKDNGDMHGPSKSEPRGQRLPIAKVFNTPVMVQGLQGLPLAELLAWGVLSWLAGRRNPRWNVAQRVAAGGLTSWILLGADWCHDLAHLAGASLVGKPADAIRIYWGTPLLVYDESHNQDVSPRQHQLRALGGPIFTTVMVPVSWFATRLTRQGSLAHDAATFAVGANTFILAFSLTPIPLLDGGSLLKWGLVRKGRSQPQAEETVRLVNRYTGYGMAIASAAAMKKRKLWPGAALAVFAAGCLAVGYGLLKEHQ
jgi:hypothetical protein